MRPHSDSTRVAFRRAVWASVAIHVVLVGAFFVLVRPSEPRAREAGLDTRAPEVRMSFVEDAPGVEVQPQPAPPAPAAPPNTGPEIGATKIQPQVPEAIAPAVAGPPLPVGPVAPAAPRTLPAELVALIRKPGASAAPIHDPNVRPAGGTAAGASVAPAMHGALKPGQTVVYLLDASGSMGAGGKFDAARAALGATLARQPATVRFQVIVYDAAARTLLPSDGTTLPATEANVRAATAALVALEPRGKSNHLVAVRAALAFRPDVIVLLTDASELNAATLKPVTGSGARPPVCVGLVTAEGVREPRELK